MPKVDLLKTIGVKKLVEPVFNAKRDELADRIENVLLLTADNRAASAAIENLVKEVRSWRL